jgi:hypothetical protein
MRLLSQALVALTIEVDDAFELETPHRTTRHGSSASRGAPWLVSSAMWFNCLRFLDDAGVTVGELERRARTPTNLDGMRRWRYLTIESTARRPGAAALLRPTAAGQRARDTWPTVHELVESRWAARDGQDRLDRLRAALNRTVEGIPFQLPDCLPIVGYGLTTRGRSTLEPRPAPTRDDSEASLLAALLARVLVGFAVAFERRSDVSLAVAANTLRVLGPAGTRVSDLPRLTGVSKETHAIALGVLQRQGMAVLADDPAGGRGKLAHLTASGVETREASRRRIAEIERRWLGSSEGGALDVAVPLLERLVGDGVRGSSPLLDALAHPPGTWRASLPPLALLPHFPVVTHRGGFPDGS